MLRSTTGGSASMCLGINKMSFSHFLFFEAAVQFVAIATLGEVVRGPGQKWELKNFLFGSDHRASEPLSRRRSRWAQSVRPAIPQPVTWLVIGSVDRRTSWDRKDSWGHLGPIPGV